MTVPTNITDLSTTAASNPPNGSSDTPQEGDDHLRAAYSFIAQLQSEKAPKASPAFTGTVTAAALTTTGNTILGDASTDTLNVGNGGLIKDASGNVGIGVSPTGKLDVLGTLGTFRVGTNGAALEFTRADVNYITASNAAGALMLQTGGSNTRLEISATGNLVMSVLNAPPTLSSNGQMVFALTSNTNLQVYARGSDGVTRSASITLA